MNVPTEKFDAARIHAMLDAFDDADSEINLTYPYFRGLCDLALQSAQLQALLQGALNHMEKMHDCEADECEVRACMSKIEAALAKAAK